MSTEKDYINMDMLRFTTAGSVDDGKALSLAGFFMTPSQFSKINWKRLSKAVVKEVMKM